jgi:hypothetical protein
MRKFVSKVRTEHLTRLTFLRAGTVALVPSCPNPRVAVTLMELKGAPARDGCMIGADCVAPSLEALARSAYCRMTERPISRIAEPYAKLESTADPRLVEP